MNKKLTKLKRLLLLILQFTLRGNLGKKNNELPLIIRLRVAIVKVWHKTTKSERGQSYAHTYTHVYDDEECAMHE